MKPINKHLVSINTIFTIHEKKYKVITIGKLRGTKRGWFIRPLSGGRDFFKDAYELDKILRKHKAENQHLLYDVNL
jgi:hypothetical protein